MPILPHPTRLLGRGGALRPIDDFRTPSKEAMQHSLISISYQVWRKERKREEKQILHPLGEFEAMYEESSKPSSSLQKTNLINHTSTTSKIDLTSICIHDNFVYAPHLQPSVTQAELFSLWPFLLHHLAPAANPRDENSGAWVFPII